MRIWRQTTGRDLNANAALLGLSDYGLFAEKMPPCFSSEGLSSHISSRLEKIRTERDSNRLRKAFEKCTHSHTRYQVLRDINIPRHMAIPHPESHLAQSLAIHRAWDSIKKHCAKPQTPISRIFVREILGHDRIFEMNYKGEERFDVEEQEIAFQAGAQYVVHADISKCFPSIYTHSIAWAVHGKKTAKTNGKDLTLYGNLLDRSCQTVADSQTNGIHIGPHSSNIIAEIILTKVDSALLKKGYENLTRHIDDYTFYAQSYEKAECFIRDVGIELREYELFLNEKKTRIVPLPQPQSENWVRELQTFQFQNGELKYSTIRSFMDLALTLAQETGKSSVLNYAIKMVPDRLNKRAKRLFVKDAINLALSFPYLSPLMQEHVFDKHTYAGIEADICLFVRRSLELGLRKIYPDTIAHALYYALHNNLPNGFDESQLKQVIEVDDCICDVLTFEYAKKHKLSATRTLVRKRANNLKGLDGRDQDAFWLLIYQVWSEADLRGQGQTFLADLKKQGFEFFKI